MAQNNNQIIDPIRLELLKTETMLDFYENKARMMKKNKGKNEFLYKIKYIKHTIQSLDTLLCTNYDATLMNIYNQIAALAKNYMIEYENC